MKCKDCGLGVKDIGELNRHKKKCQASIGQAAPESDVYLFPIELCPEETKLYAQGHMVGLRVTGILTTGGIKVEGVSLIR